MLRLAWQLSRYEPHREQLVGNGQENTEKIDITSIYEKICAVIKPIISPFFFPHHRDILILISSGL